MALGNDRPTPGEERPTPDLLKGLPPGRRAMIAAHAALNPKFEAALREFGIEFTGEERDPYAQLAAAAASRDGSPAHIPRVRLADTALTLLRSSPPGPNDPRAVPDEVLLELIDPADLGTTNQPNALTSVYEALVAASGTDVGDDQSWSTLLGHPGASLHPDLRRIQNPRGTSQLRLVDNEYAARIEVRFEVLDPNSDGLARVAPRVVPDRWSAYNHFFCSMGLTNRDEHLAPGQTLVTPSPDAPSWQRVYLEKVGSCPQGWFPDTFLLFTWSRAAAQLVCYYELARRRPGDRTQLTIDEGYIQIDQLPGRYVVTALKTVLFDDERVGSGGQMLAEFAFVLGWMDHAISWFSDDAANVNDPAVTPDPAPDLTSELQEVLYECEADVRAALADVDVQVKAAVNQISSGQYGLDSYVQNSAKLVDGTIRYSAQAMCNGIKLALALKPKEDEDS
jgi:hypothetical protein